MNASQLAPAAGGDDRPATALVIAAGAFWFIAGLLYLVSESIAAAAFPGYSYAHNYISDLGIPYPDLIGGRLVHSASAGVMNVGFIAEGICFILAALAFAKARLRFGLGSALFLLLALAHGSGLVLIGLVSSGSREVAAGIGHWHGVGAALAIVGGNAAILAAARHFRKQGAPSSYCRASTALALAGLLSLALLIVDGYSPVVADGIAERGSVYSVMVWELLTGPVLLRWALRSRAC